jgi:hypothetical protein
LDQGTWSAVSCQSPVTRTGSHRPSVANDHGSPDDHGGDVQGRHGVVDDWELA